jgi:hypothetical protein
MIDSPSPSSSSSNQQQTEVRRNSSSNSEQTPSATGYDPSIGKSLTIKNFLFDIINRW